MSRSNIAHNDCIQELYPFQNGYFMRITILKKFRKTDIERIGAITLWLKLAGGVVLGLIIAILLINIPIWLMK